MQQELPDFDTLKRMAEQNPEALESLRQQHVNALIDRAPQTLKRRLRGLQFQIDAQCRLHPTPMAACIKLSQMMYDSFSELRYALNEATGQGPSWPERPQASVDSATQPAQVLDFNARRSIS